MSAFVGSEVIGCRLGGLFGLREAKLERKLGREAREINIWVSVPISFIGQDPSIRDRKWKLEGESPIPQ